MRKALILNREVKAVSNFNEHSYIQTQLKGVSNERPINFTFVLSWQMDFFPFPLQETLALFFLRDIIMSRAFQTLDMGAPDIRRI